MTDAIRDQAIRRGIRRLCHFTPSRNLVHIATDPLGVLATQHLNEGERGIYNPTDLQRLDGHRGHICCSIHYPNAWYFRKARQKDRIFTDWVVLLIQPHHLWKDGTMFCPRNAASGFGRDVRQGIEAFEAMFADSVVGAYGNTFTRGGSLADYLPTDEQAEVLVPDRVAREDVIGIAVVDEAQAKREITRMRLLNVRLPRILIAPTFFDAYALSGLRSSGIAPAEDEYYAGDDNG